jgi:ABC-type glycerol-3-phosphate transport system substrate-binding protein
MKKHILPFIVATICIISGLTGCGENSPESLVSVSGANASASTGETNEEFSYWLGAGSDPFYTDYADNPVIRYMTKYMKWGQNKNVNVSLKFQIPPTGTQSDNLNTMIASGDYTDIIDGSYYTGSIIDLYNDGVIIDLTDYVKKYMPHYVAWLDAHPASKKMCTTTVNGEVKYLKIYDANDTVDSWGGFCYRRDWLVKYGKNPTTQVAFTGGWSNGNWTDDVVFPSKETYPKTLSDWEWMLGIFKTALAGEGITDGYCMSLPYPGYFGTGDLTSSFGGCYGYYLDSTNTTVKFGGEEPAFRAYTEMMADWYAKGYIDTKFTEHTSDMFYQIDSTKMRNGKAGLFYGGAGNLNNSMDISEGKENSETNGYTNGICIFGAPQPINDKYGDTSMQNLDPFYFYRQGQVSSYIVITTKAQEKNLPALMDFFDYMYTDEGAALGYFGLSKEEYDICQDPFYQAHGYTQGAYYWVDSEGNPWVEGTSTGQKYGRYVEGLDPSSEIAGGMKNLRCVGRELGPGSLYNTNPAVMQDGVKKWNMYESNFNLYVNGLTKSLSGDAAKAYSTAYNNVNTFLQQRLPDFIKGVKKATDDTTWNGLVTALKKYKTDAVKTILQNAYDSL